MSLPSHIASTLAICFMIMVLILYDSVKYDAHVWSELVNLIYSRLSLTPKAVFTFKHFFFIIFFLHTSAMASELASNINNRILMM